MMQRLLLLIVVGVIGLGSVPFAHAESGDPSDLFLNAYMSVQQGEKLEHDGNYKAALAKYRYAASLLEQIHSRSPDWQPLIVDYRKKKTAASISNLQKKISAQARALILKNPPSEPEPPLPQKGESTPVPGPSFSAPPPSPP